MQFFLTGAATAEDYDRSLQSLQDIYTMGPVAVLRLQFVAKATLRINSISAAPAKSLVR